jgi:hypothetical protein
MAQLKAAAALAAAIATKTRMSKKDIQLSFWGAASHRFSPARQDHDEGATIPLVQLPY